MHITVRGQVCWEKRERWWCSSLGTVTASEEHPALPKAVFPDFKATLLSAWRHEFAYEEAAPLWNTATRKTWAVPSCHSHGLFGVRL